MIPIIHKACGKQCAWFAKDNPPVAGDYFGARDWIRLDGTHPVPGTKMDETCPACGGHIAIQGEITFSS